MMILMMMMKRVTTYFNTAQLLPYKKKTIIPNYCRIWYNMAVTLPPPPARADYTLSASSCVALQAFVLNFHRRRVVG